MLVDELVSLIRFDMPASSKTALAGVKKAVSGITDHMKSLGIVTAVTSGIFAAFSVNAAKDATNLANLSQSTGVAMEEIEALGAMYRQVGGDAKEFASDAEAFMRQWQQPLNLERMIDLSREFVGLTEQQAFQIGRAHGFSDSMIRTLMKGPDEIRKMAEHAEKYNATSKDSLANLRALDATWIRLKNVIGPVANEIQGAFAPILEGGLTWLAELLEENKDSIRETMTAISAGIKSGLDAIGAAWEIAKPYLVEGWDMAKAAALDAWTAVEPIFTAWAGAWKSVFDSVSVLDFSGLFSSLLLEGGFIDSIKMGLLSIRDSIVGFYEEVSRVIDGGALGRMWESLKNIIDSPVVEVLTNIGKAIAAIAWEEIKAGFEALKAVVEPVLNAFEGLLQVVEGIANLDLLQALEGFQKIGYAIGDAFEKVFLEILPKLGEELVKIIKLAFSKLPVIGEYFKESPVEAAAKMSNDEAAIKSKADELYAEKGGLFSYYTPEQADAEARDWFNKTHLIPRYRAMQEQGVSEEGSDFGTGGNSQEVNVTQIFYGPANPEILGPAAAMAIRETQKINAGGQAQPIMSP